ncbi:phage major capsid protein, partial [Snodgrassella communis]
SPEAAARSAAMASYLRSGEINAALTKDGELGVVAPSEWDRTLTNKLVEISPARQLFNVISTEKAAFKKVYNILSMLITAGYFYAHREDLGRAENAAVPVNAHNLLDLHRKRPALK